MSNAAAARQNILERLRSGRVQAGIDPSKVEPPLRVTPGPQRSAEEKLKLLRTRMEAVKTEFVDSTKSGWPADLRELLVRERLDRLAYAPETPDGERIAAHWKSSGNGNAPALIPYDQPIEKLRQALFEAVSAGVTSTLGGIADTGTLILWPTRAEPRLLSLVPPVHIALLDPDKIFNSLPEAMTQMRWAAGMPTNSLLVSGPSKTADIEQTLCYGVHGPKRLIVMVLKG